MLLGDPFAKFLRDHRRSLLGWTLGVTAVAVMYAAFYPSMRTPAFADAMKSYPESIKKALNFTDVTTAAGYLGATVYGLLAAILLVVFAIAAGARAVAGDEDAGTLDLVLAYPVGRQKLLWQRFAAVAVQIAVICAVMLLALLALSGPAKLTGIGAGNLAAATLHLALLGLFFAALALGVGAATGRRGLVLGVGAGVAAVGYFANTLADQIDGLGWLRRLSPFYYDLSTEPLRHGVSPGHCAVLLLASLVLVALGGLVFGRRDIGVG